MDDSAEQFKIRQHVRSTCSLRAEVGITEHSPTRAALSRTVGNGTGVFGATVVDCSPGGMGLESPVFLPRQARLCLRVELSNPGEPSTPLDLEGTVQRVAMISREPRYYLGLDFKGRNAPTPAVIERLLNHVAAQKRPPGEGGLAA